MCSVVATVVGMRFVAYQQSTQGTVEDIFRALNKLPNGDISDEQLLQIDPRLSRATGYSSKKVDGGVTLEINIFMRTLINKIPNAPRIKSGNPIIHIQLANSWPVKNVNVVHVWSPDILIKLETGYIPLDIYINNNAFQTIDQKHTNAVYPFFDGGKW